MENKLLKKKFKKTKIYRGNYKLWKNLIKIFLKHLMQKQHLKQVTISF